MLRNTRATIEACRLFLCPMPPPRQTQRRRDRFVPVRRKFAGAHAERRGFTLLELLGAVAIGSVMAAVAVSEFRANTHDLWQAHTVLLADLRQARASSLTKGDHFRIRVINATSYELRRLRDDDNNKVWTADAQAVRVRSLPEGLTISSNGGSTFEFNTRGLMINPNAAAVLTLVDARTGYDRRITVWPSGQVAPL